MNLEIKSNGEIYNVIYDDEYADMVSIHTWHIDHGYARASLWKHGKRSSMSMHRLILDNDSKHTHHINGNRLDNRRINLMPLTAKDHSKKHGKRTGKKNKGWFTKGNRAKLTDCLVLELRKRFANGESARKMALELGLGHTPVTYAISGKTWKHLPLKPRLNGGKEERQ